MPCRGTSLRAHNQTHRFHFTACVCASRYDPLFIILLLQANYILFSTVTGGIYFKEFAELTVFSAAMFGLGVAIMFVGLYLLAPVTSFEEDQVVIPFPRPLHAQTTRLCTSRPNGPPSRPPISATDPRPLILPAGGRPRLAA